MLKKIRALINGTEAYDMNKYVNEGMSWHVPEQGGKFFYMMAQ